MPAHRFRHLLDLTQHRVTGLLVVALFGVIVSSQLSCKRQTHPDPRTLRTAQGGRYYGGTFRVNENGELRSLDPVGVNDVTSSHLSEQIYDQLLYFDENLNLTNELAERWEISDDGKTYTYHLRKGVYFQDDPCFEGGKGRLLTATDVVYSFTRICDARIRTLSSEFFRGKVEGAEEYYAATQHPQADGSISPNHISGYWAPNDSTFCIRLLQPFGPFENMVALNSTGIVPHEAVEKYGADFFRHPVGSGPFCFHHWSQDVDCLLIRNPHYWKHDEFGNQLPYLDSIRTLFVKDDKIQLLEFREGNLEESYRIPTEFFTTMVDEHKNLRPAFQQFVLLRKMALASQYYGMLTQESVFKDVRIRKAFNYAIDRRRIIEYVLQGQAGAPAIHGLVPPTMPGYASDSIVGYDYNLPLARQLLSEAGYPGGKGFPDVTLQLNSGGGRNTIVAEAVQTMLSENLGIRVQLKMVEFAQHLDAIDHGKTEFFRLGWVADYPDAESFLSLFYGKLVPDKLDEASPQNSTRLRSEKFDRIFEKARATSNRAERNELYRQAEQIAMNESPMMLTFYDEDYRLIQPYVCGYRNNAMDKRPYVYVWFDKAKMGP